MKTKFFALFLIFATAFLSCKTTEKVQIADDGNFVPNAIMFKVADEVPLQITVSEEGLVDVTTLPFLKKVKNIEIKAVTKPFTLDDPKLQRIFRLTFSPESEINNLIKSLEKMKEVEYAEKIYIKNLYKQ